MKKHSFKQSTQTGKPAVAVTVGLAISLALTFVMSAMIAWAVADGRLPEDAMHTAVWPIQFLSAAVGCMTATLLAGNMPAIISAVCGVAYLFLLAACNILFLDGSMGGIGSGVISVICGIFVPIILQLMGKKGRNTKRRH